MQSPRHWTKGEVCLGVRRRPAEDDGVGAPPPAVEPSAGSTWTSSLSGFCTRACFPRIASATLANGVPLETVRNRSAPSACGPNVDQAGPAGTGCPATVRDELGEIVEGDWQQFGWGRPLTERCRRRVRRTGRGHPRRQLHSADPGGPSVPASAAAGPAGDHGRPRSDRLVYYTVTRNRAVESEVHGHPRS
jgi:hypothetical protein